MFTGNEKVWPFRDIAVPAPRGHQPPVPGDSGGGELVLDLALKRLDELGVEVRHDTGATALVTDDGARRGRDLEDASARPVRCGPGPW